jgi:hypothetical protein
MFAVNASMHLWDLYHVEPFCPLILGRLHFVFETMWRITGTPCHKGMIEVMPPEPNDCHLISKSKE